jgi:hypothetical protein
MEKVEGPDEDGACRRMAHTCCWCCVAHEACDGIFCPSLSAFERYFMRADSVSCAGKFRIAASGT